MRKSVVGCSAVAAQTSHVFFKKSDLRGIFVQIILVTYHVFFKNADVRGYFLKINSVTYHAFFKNADLRGRSAIFLFLPVAMYCLRIPTGKECAHLSLSAD